LSPAQTAELGELLEYVQGVLRSAAENAVQRPGQERIELEFAEWQQLLDLQAQLAVMLGRIGEPGRD
jgi:hypothetical protein